MTQSICPSLNSSLVALGDDDVDGVERLRCGGGDASDTGGLAACVHRLIMAQAAGRA
jgi:hypothetical protein